MAGSLGSGQKVIGGMAPPSFLELWFVSINTRCRQIIVDWANHCILMGTVIFIRRVRSIALRVYTNMAYFEVDGRQQADFFVVILGIQVESICLEEISLLSSDRCMGPPLFFK